MDVALKPEFEAFIARKLTTGHYSSASEIVNEALETFMEQDDFSSEHAAYLRRELKRGADQLDRGERATFTAESIIAEERRRAAESIQETKR